MAHIDHLTFRRERVAMLVQVLDLFAHGVGVCAHGAEFRKGEDAAVEAHALLPVEHRAAVFELDGQCHEQKQGRQQQQRRRHRKQVDGALEGRHALGVPAGRRA